jgi:DNA-binding transcriptional ArsR family regulator
MVTATDKHPPRLDLVFGALSDASRRLIVERLAAGDTSIVELRSRLPMSAPAVTKHLRVLERAGLLKRTKTGRIRVCHLKREPLNNAAAWIEKYRQFWDERFDDLAKFMEETAGKPTKKGTKP